MALAVAASVLMVMYSDELTNILGGRAVRMEYETALFDTDEIININIEMDEDTWDDMIGNATNEEYYVCNVIVNGKRINNVAIRAKGNMSLVAIDSNPDTDRFSFKLEFDHFVEGQTCYGLDKLILNNNFADATNMKEAVVYDMYHYLDTDASLYNYAKISVNGEYWGVYLALEAVEESFMLRNYGTQDGELYKPESSALIGTEYEPADSVIINMPGMDTNPQENVDYGSSLNYTDDSLDSYPAIWAGGMTSSNDSDHERVVTAIRNISEGTDLETYMDVDNILKYMAVHTFAVNMDSFSSNMTHNYYLYEYDGRLNIIPWDYNLSFGGMAMGGAREGTKIINDAIDTPFSGTEFFDALLENDEYLERYHAYLQMLVDEYVNGGRFDETYNRIRSQIDPLVESDPTAFFSYEDYQTAAPILYDVIKLRAESIDGQIKGTIPSTDEEQRKNYSSLIDGSSIDVYAMGQFDFIDNETTDEESSKTPGPMGGQTTPVIAPVSDADTSGNESPGVVPEDAPEGMPEGAEGMPGMFDPENPPEGVEIDPDNPPEMPVFDPENPPEDYDPDNPPPMPVFDPENPPDAENMPEIPAEVSEPSEPEITEETEATEETEVTEETVETSLIEETETEPAEEITDTIDEVSLSVTEFGLLEKVNATVYLAFLWLMLVALFLVNLIKRRRT